MRLAEQTKSRDVWNGDSGVRHPAHQIQLQRFTLPTQMTLVTRAFVIRGIPIPTAASRLRHYSSLFQVQIYYDFSYNVNGFTFNLFVKKTYICPCVYY
jgi:hypothetical protein